MFHRILKTAVEGGASDIHVKIGTPVVFRINRQLIAIECPFPTLDWMNNVVHQITPAHLVKRVEQEREADFSYYVPEIGRFRTNLFQQRGHWCLAMRHVKTNVPSFEELGLLDQLKRISESPRGIVLVAGSTGSGKSTTLAAMIEHINANHKKHIITLEDPIEYLFTDRMSIIEQREIGLDTTSFATGLKNVLRQDPDVLVIGEMRDPASIAAAISAANIGHLVISTLHTADAAKSIQRILEFFPGSDRESARRQLATTLHAVICQKLIAGTRGNILPAVEILINNASVEKLIAGGALEKLGGAMEMGGGDGMQTFDQALYDKWKDQEITAEIALQFATSAKDLKLRMQGMGGR